MTSPLHTDEFVRMRDAVSSLRDALASVAQRCGSAPLAASKAESELKTFRRPESVHTAQSQAWLLLEVSSDQLTAFVKTISEPFETVAPFTCVRSLLEAAALACWLLDPAIDVEMRIARSLALRHEGLAQQVKWARAAGEDPEPAKRRVLQVIATASEMNYAPIADARGRPSGAGQQIPSVTEIISAMLHEEPLYRVLSAVAHGHHWALQQLSFERAPELDVVSSTSGSRLSGLIKGVKASSLAFLVIVAASSLARAVWYQAAYFGWDVEELRILLESAFDRLNATDHVRFWRAAT